MIRKLSKCIHQSFSPISLFKQRGSLQLLDILFQYTQDIPMPQFFKQKYQLQYVAVYCGYDPTNDSLHIGNLLSIISLIRLQQLGFRPIFLVGGATGNIGDPSGKQFERKIIEQHEIEQNCNKIMSELRSIYENISRYRNCKAHSSEQLIIINNKEFYKQENVIQFVKKVGKKFRINSLINKQYIKQRLLSEEGISFTQFTYQIFQAYDFKTLLETYNCFVQVGGQDQWGNITLGCQYIKKQLKKQAFGLTLKLLLTKEGKKFGKSQGNAIFLSRQKTSDDQFYQYFFNLSDSQLQTYFLNFTFLSLEQIRHILQNHKNCPQERRAQRRLCQQILLMIRNCKKSDQRKLLYQKNLKQLTKKSQQQVYQIMNQFQHKTYLNQQELSRMTILDVIWQSKILKSKNQIRNNVQMGGISISGNKIQTYQLQNNFLQNNYSSFIIANKYIVLKVGKKNVKLIILK